MNNQLNTYGKNNLVENQSQLIDDLSKIKPSLDGMYNIEKTDLDRPFLHDVGKTPEENLLGNNLAGQHSPIENQVKNLNNSPKLNGNIIVMDELPENVEVIDVKLNDLENIDIQAIENKIKELENNSNNEVSANNVVSANNEVSMNNEVSAKNEVSANNEETEVSKEPVVSLDNEVSMNNEVAEETVEEKSNLTKAFNDLYHDIRLNKIILFIFLIVMGVIFVVYKKKILKFLSK